MGKRIPSFTDNQLKTMAKMLPRVNRKTGKHTRNCECYLCLTAKLEAFKERIKEMRGVRPAHPEQCVPVRAYWRGQANFLSRSPILRDAVARIIRELVGK